MLVTLKTTEQVETERTKIVAEIVELLRQQGRSNFRYAKRINALRNKLIATEKNLGRL